VGPARVNVLSGCTIKGYLYIILRISFSSVHSAGFTIVIRCA